MAHTVARIMAAAHAGQILASAETLSTGASSISSPSLGRHELRGLAESVELFQMEDV